MSTATKVAPIVGTVHLIGRLVVIPESGQTNRFITTHLPNLDSAVVLHKAGKRQRPYLLVTGTLAYGFVDGQHILMLRFKIGGMALTGIVFVPAMTQIEIPTNKRPLVISFRLDLSPTGIEQTLSITGTAQFQKFGLAVTEPVVGVTGEIVLQDQDDMIIRVDCGTITAEASLRTKIPPNYLLFLET